MINWFSPPNGCECHYQLNECRHLHSFKVVDEYLKNLPFYSLLLKEMETAKECDSEIIQMFSRMSPNYSASFMCLVILSMPSTFIQNFVAKKDSRLATSTLATSILAS